MENGGGPLFTVPVVMSVWFDMEKMEAQERSSVSIPCFSRSYDTVKITQCKGRARWNRRVLVHCGDSSISLTDDDNDNLVSTVTMNEGRGLDFFFFNTPSLSRGFRLVSLLAHSGFGVRSC